MNQHIVIVGGGQAGGQLAINLRQRKYTGPVTLIGGERHTPYQRPPLSKQVLLGKWPAERCFLRNEAFFTGQDIELRTDCWVEEIDSASRVLSLAHGDSVAFDQLVLATGARLRKLDCQGAQLDGVCYLRDLNQATALRGRLEDKPKVVIVGAGYIGLEVAASARQLGCEVTVVEALNGVLQRGALAPIAVATFERHTEHGVEFMFRQTVAAFSGSDGRLERVELTSGDSLRADLAIVGIGVTPNTELAEQTRCQLRDGAIAVDQHCATNVAGIHAIGDAVSQQHPRFAKPIRLESVQNALSQARALAATLAGEPTAADDVPTFWSDQYDMKLQFAGLPALDDELVVRGEPTDGKFSAWSVRDGVIQAAQLVSNPKEFMRARQLIEQAASVDPDRLADANIDLKELLS